MPASSARGSLTVALRMQQMTGVLIDDAALAWESLHIARMPRPAR